MLYKMEDILPCEVNLENLTLERVQFYTVVKHRRDVKAFEVLKKSIRKNISLLKWRVSNAIARSKKVEEGMPIVKTSKITRESKLIALMKKENAGFQKSTKYDEGKTKRRGRSKLYVYNDLISDSETEEPPKIVYKRTRKRKNDSLTDNNSKSSDSPVSSKLVNQRTMKQWITFYILFAVTMLLIDFLRRLCHMIRQ